MYILSKLFIDPNSGKFKFLGGYRFTSGSLKTDPARARIGAVAQTDDADADNPFELFIDVQGHATSAAARTVFLQTGEELLSQSGVLSIQAAGTLELGGVETAFAAPNDGDALIYDLATTKYKPLPVTSGTVTHTGALTAGKILIGNDAADVKVSDASIATDGLYDFPNTYAKTDTTAHFVAILAQSSDGTNPLVLLLTQLGASAAAGRTYKLQTGEFLLSNSGVLALQPDGGTLTIAGKEIAPGTPATGEGLVWDGAKFAPSAVGDVTHTGALTANHIAIGNGTPDIKESLATLDPSTGLFAFINSYAKTDTTAHIVGLLTQSSDGTGPFVLYFTQIGASSSGARTMEIQTGEFGVSNSGVLSLQPGGGTVKLGGSIIDLSTHTDGNLLTWDAGTGTAHLKPFALPSTGVTAGTYGDSQNVGQFTVDAEGRITSAANVLTRATVTHTTGPLTTNGLIGGGGGDDIKRIDLSGDVTTGGSGVTTLATVASAGTVGDSTHVAQVTNNAKGLITGLTSVAIQQGIELSAACNSTLVLTTSFVDVPGASVTLTRGGTWLIYAVADLFEGGGTTPQVQCVAGGNVLVGVALANLSANSEGSFSQIWAYGPATNGDVVKLQGKKLSGSSTSLVNATNTKVIAQWIHD